MASATPAWEPQPAPPTASPAALEFAVLEACLASRSARQLPLHEMESQQQSKGREVQRLLLQAHLEQRSTGEGERPCASETSSERCGIPSPTQHPLPQNRLWTGAGGPHGLFAPGLTQPLSPGSNPGFARSLLLLPAAAALGQGGGPEPLPRGGRGPGRAHRRFGFQTQPGGTLARCGPGF